MGQVVPGCGMGDRPGLGSAVLGTLGAWPVCFRRVFLNQVNKEQAKGMLITSPSEIRDKCAHLGYTRSPVYTSDHYENSRCIVINIDVTGKYNKS